MNREEWLTKIAEAVEPIYHRKGYRLSKYRLTCGWPCKFALSVRQRRIGECHSASVSKGKIAEIFISPLLDDPAEVAGVVCHELIHVAVGNQCGHKGQFRAACKHLGMVGNPKHALPGKQFAEELKRIIERLGAYPHQAIAASERPKKPSKDVRLVCEDCGCPLSISLKWMEEAGLPTCGCGGEMILKQKR